MPDTEAVCLVVLRKNGMADRIRYAHLPYFSGIRYQTIYHEQYNRADKEI